MTTTATSSLIENGRAILDFARRCTLRLVDGIPAEKLCHQPVPKANHALWVLGHLACTDDWFAGTIGKRAPVVDASWATLFGMNSTPTGDLQAYPAAGDVKAALGQARQSLLETFQAMDEQQLLGPLPDELKGFAPNLAGVMSSIAWHEGLHAGQLSAVRRSLGLPQALEM